MAYRVEIICDGMNPSQDVRRGRQAPGCRRSIEVRTETAYGALTSAKHEAIRRGWRQARWGWACPICREGASDQAA